MDPRLPSQAGPAPHPPRALVVVIVCSSSSEPQNRHGSRHLSVLDLMESLRPMSPSSPVPPVVALESFAFLVCATHKSPLCVYPSTFHAGCAHAVLLNLSDTNDFLASGVELQAADRIILDRLDLKVLRKLR
jgi:hypothetical protein